MNLQTILSHPEKKKILENLLAEKIIGEDFVILSSPYRANLRL